MFVGNEWKERQWGPAFTGCNPVSRRGEREGRERDRERESVVAALWAAVVS